MENSHADKVKAACAIATSGSFVWGVRTAWKQAKPLKPHELSNSNLLGGVGFAFRALGLATIITVSGFGFFIVGVSALMNVNTPKQFGNKMRSLIGNPNKPQNSGESYETLTELFEAVSKKRE